MRKTAIVSAGSLPSSRQALITPRATMSTRVLETIDIITAIFSTPSLLQHLHRQALRLGDRGVAADLGVVGGLAALAADRVGERQRAAAGADHEPEVAVEAVVLALDHAAVVGGVDRLDVALELRRLVELARLGEVDADLGRASSLWRPTASSSISMWASRATKDAVREPRERVDLGEGHVVVALQAGELRASTAVARLSSEPVIPQRGDRLLRLEVGDRMEVGEVAAADVVGVLLGDLLDVDPAHVAEQHHRPLRAPVPEHRGVVLLLDLGLRVDEDADRACGRRSRARGSRRRAPRPPRGCRRT